MTERTTWNFYSTGRLFFGCGAVRELANLVRRFTAQRFLIVTDPALVSAGVVDRVRQPLIDAGHTVDVFDGGEPEPSIDVANTAIEHARSFAPDCIIGVGGGSNMDLAKITANVVTHGGTVHDYFEFDNVPGPILPLVCIPTTSGTGSEVSHAAVLTDTANKMKVSTLSNFLRPALAVVDPELTVSCPPQATADSGIDALTHAIEGYTATRSTLLDVPPGTDFPYDGSNPVGDVLAEKAIRLIGQHFVNAVQQPDNLDARSGMALAATLAGMSFSNCGVAIVHALEYPLGGTLHCSHGAGNGLLLPYVMRFNLEARLPEFANIAAWLGEDVSPLNQTEAAERSIKAVERLRAATGIPARIADIGGKAEQLEEFAAKAFGIRRLMTLNARLPTEADLLGILQAAL